MLAGCVRGIRAAALYVWLSWGGRSVATAKSAGARDTATKGGRRWFPKEAGSRLSWMGWLAKRYGGGGGGTKWAGSGGSEGGSRRR